MKLCDRYNIEKNVILLSKSFFKSNFSKRTIKDIPILFPESERQSKLKDVSSTLESEQMGDEKLIYLFYRPLENRKKIKAYEFAQDLLASFKEIDSRKTR